jgi:hypothetical protein
MWLNFGVYMALRLDDYAEIEKATGGWCALVAFEFCF